MALTTIAYTSTLTTTASTSTLTTTAYTSTLTITAVIFSTAFTSTSASLQFQLLIFPLLFSSTQLILFCQFATCTSISHGHLLARFRSNSELIVIYKYMQLWVNGLIKYRSNQGGISNLVKMYKTQLISDCWALIEGNMR